MSDVISLELSRLHIDDNHIIQLAVSPYVQNLRWLDVCWNEGITRIGVNDICKAVNEGRLRKLNWLDLNGTSCNATPYVDGSYWRMAPAARELASEFGPQKWMMLGSRKMEEEGIEILSRVERDIPPSRFKY